MNTDKDFFKNISKRDVYNISSPQQYTWKQRAMSPNIQFMSDNMTSNMTKNTNLDVESASAAR